MTRPHIRIETSAGGLRVGCSACPHWHAFCATRAAAHDSASAHEANVHAGEYRARNAAKMYARRHAKDADTPHEIMNV